MHKIRSLARRGSGRVVPTRGRRSSQQQQQDSAEIPQQQQQQASSSSLSLAVSFAKPEREGGLRRLGSSASANALAAFGKRIFGSKIHRQQQQEDRNSASGGADARPRAPSRHRSLDLLGGVYSSRRGRRTPVQHVHALSGGTSLIDIQAFGRAGERTRAWDGEDARRYEIERGLEGRRASEVMRSFDARRELVDVMTVDLQEASPRPLSASRPAVGAPRRTHQRSKSSTSGLTRTTSLRVGQRIVNHQDLDFVVRLGDVAQSRRPFVSRSRPQHATRTRMRVRPACPVVADVFAVEDTVRRNREATLEVLVGKGRTREVGEEDEQVQIVQTEEEGCYDAGSEGDCVETVRAERPVPNFLEHSYSTFLHDAFISTTAGIYPSRPQRNFSHLDLPTIFDRSDSSEGVEGMTHSQTFPWGLFPAPPRKEKAECESDALVVTLPLGANSLKEKKRSKDKMAESVVRAPVVSTPRPWRMKDLEKLPSAEPADRIARVVRWAADVHEAMDSTESSEDDEAVPIVNDKKDMRAPLPAPYVPYWLNC